MDLALEVSVPNGSPTEACDEECGGGAADECGGGDRIGRRTRCSGNRAARQMVGRTTIDRAGADRLQHLRAVGGAAERQLLCTAVPVAVLLTVPGAELRAPGLANIWLVVEPVARVPGAGHPARVPRYLLLLPQSVLPLVLLVAASVLHTGCPTALQR